MAPHRCPTPKAVARQVPQLAVSDAQARLVNRAKAKDFMTGHNQWVQRGFDDGVFLLTGSLDEAEGGAVLAANTTLEALRARVQEDPFVEHGVVDADVHVIAPSRMDSRLAGILRTRD